MSHFIEQQMFNQPMRTFSTNSRPWTQWETVKHRCSLCNFAWVADGCTLAKFRHLNKNVHQPICFCQKKCQPTTTNPYCWGQNQHLLPWALRAAVRIRKMSLGIPNHSAWLQDSTTLNYHWWIEFVWEAACFFFLSLESNKLWLCGWRIRPGDPRGYLHWL